MHKHEGKWCEVSSATLNAKRGLDIVLDNGTDKTVSRTQLVRFPRQALPTAKEILRASGVQSLPRFYPVQQAMFNAADENGHHFYGGFQRLKRKWVWNKGTTETSFQDGTFANLAVYEYFSFESREAFEVFYSTVPQDCKCFFEMAREGTTVKLYLDVDDEADTQSRSKLDETIPLLCEYYQTSFGKPLNAKQIAATDGSRQKPSCYKNSFHLTINNGHGLVAPVIGEDNDMKTFVHSFVAHLESIGRSDLAGAVDKGVYTPNRMMRMIGSCKADDTTKTPFRQLGDGNVADHYIQSDGVLVVMELPATMRTTQSGQKCVSCKSQGRRTGKSVGLNSFPEAIRKKFETYATDICPEATFRTAEILNHESEGSRVFSTYCIINGGSWDCPMCKDDPQVPGGRHNENNFVLKYKERFDEFQLLCLWAESNQRACSKVIGHISRKDSQATHYTLLGVQPAADVGEIKVAYRKCTRAEGVTDEQMDQLDDAWETLRDADKRAEYDKSVEQGGDDPDELQATVGFREGAITLADVKQVNEMLFQYITSNQYRAYLPGYEDGQCIDMDLVVGKGWVEEIKEKQGEDKFIMHYEPKITIELRTGGTSFVCPYAHCTHKASDENLCLTYTVNQCNLRRNVGCCQLIRTCTRANKPGVAVWDMCKRMVQHEADVTEDMVSYYIARHLNDTVSFMTEKGVGFATKKESGGYDLFSSKYAGDLCDAWAKKTLVGSVHNFAPLPKLGMDISFKDMWFRLKSSQYRKEYRTVGFFPVAHPYTEVPKEKRPPADLLNTFEKFAITEKDARNYCLRHKILDAADFEPPKPPLDTIVDYYTARDVLDACDDDVTIAAKLQAHWIEKSALLPGDFGNDCLPTFTGWQKLRPYLLDVRMGEKQTIGAVTPDQWRPHPVLTEEGRKKLDEFVKPITDHILEIVCRGSDVDCQYFHDYDAHLLQKPWEKPRVAKVLRSDGKGAGKGAVVDPMLAIVGGEEPHYHGTEVSDASSILEGNMNGMLSQKTAIVLDEAYWAGSSKDKGKLRNLITCKRSTIRQMYTNPFKEESFLRLFFMSNDIQVVPYDSECERRFKCFDLDNRYKGVANEQTKAHFRPIYAIPNEVYALWLYHRDITGFDPSVFSIGEAEFGQINSSLSPVQQWWFTCLDQGYIALESARKIVRVIIDRGEDTRVEEREKPHKREWTFEQYIPKQVLYAAYKQSLNGQHARPVPDNQFFKELRKLFTEDTIEVKEKMPTGYAGMPGRPPAVRFASLERCRDEWQKKYGQTWQTPEHTPKQRAARIILSHYHAYCFRQRNKYEIRKGDGSRVRHYGEPIWSVAGQVQAGGTYHRNDKHELYSTWVRHFIHTRVDLVNKDGSPRWVLDAQ
eukprot:COSAG02_NODE_1410_length_12758_cov_67.963504_7_plen_1366_part_00